MASNIALRRALCKQCNVNFKAAPDRRLTPWLRNLLKRRARADRRVCSILLCEWRGDGVLGLRSASADEWVIMPGLGAPSKQRMHQPISGTRSHPRAEVDSRFALLAPRSPSRSTTGAALLGSSTDAPPEEIQARYRRQLSAYHPDKLIAVAALLNLARSGVIHLIQEAYERIKRHRRPSA